jgi:hypothetical protein
MHIKEAIQNILKDGNIDLFIDMDGVIAAYEFGMPLDFDKKRPLLSNINKIKEISKLEGVTLHILSCCKKDYQITLKNEWLNKYAPFFEKDKRFILSKETIKDLSSANMKKEFLEKYETTSQIVVIDDDNQVIKTIGNNLSNVIVLQDSELID